MATEARQSRAEEARGPIHEVHTDTWEEEGLLAAPPPRPGMTQRWVASIRAGQAAATNLIRRKNQGWRARMADTAPPGVSCPALEIKGLGNVIAIEGMILMERPLAMHVKHMDRNRAQTKAQAQAIREHVLSGNKNLRGMGHTSIEVSRSVSRGRPVNVADDD